jgi:hypothetical protein
MDTGQSSITDALKNLHLRTDHTGRLGFGRYRTEIERCELLEKLHLVREAINREAGQLIVEEQMYIQPQTIQCKYTFEEGGMVWEMTLVLTRNGPTMVFSWWKRDGRRKWGGIRRLYSCFRGSSERVLTLKLQFQPATVNNADLEQWFTYLISGFRDSFRPARAKDVPPKRSWLAGPFSFHRL